MTFVWHEEKVRGNIHLAQNWYWAVDIAWFTCPNRLKGQVQVKSDSSHKLPVSIPPVCWTGLSENWIFVAEEIHLLTHLNFNPSHILPPSKGISLPVTTHPGHSHLERPETSSTSMTSCERDKECLNDDVFSDSLSWRKQSQTGTEAER